MSRYARFGRAPGLMRSRSLNRGTEVRVTPRPVVGPFTPGNQWDDNRTAPIVPRCPEGPRSRSGYFHSLPSTVDYSTDADGTPRAGTPARPRQLRRGWPGRGRAA